MDREPYPVTIFRTRYGGTYEGGEWAAFNLDHDQISVEAIDDDVTCMGWWSDFKGPIGKGPSPQLAYDDLKNQLNNVKDVESN